MSGNKCAPVPASWEELLPSKMATVSVPGRRRCRRVRDANGKRERNPRFCGASGGFAVKGATYRSGPVETRTQSFRSRTDLSQYAANSGVGWITP